MHITFYRRTEFLIRPQSSASVLQKNLVALFSAAVVALHKEVCRPMLACFATEVSPATLFQVKIPVDDLGVFLGMLLDWSVRTSENTLERLSAWHIIAAVINKREQGDCVAR